MSEKTKNRILPCVFLLFIFSFVIALVLMPKKDFSEKEKRVLAKFPEITDESVMNGKFTDGLEKYLSDRFPLRDAFIGIDAYLGLSLGKTGENGIYKAKDGYLITVPSKFDESKCAKNAGYIEKFIDRTNLQSSVIVIPQAGYTLSDKLPLNHKEYKDGAIFDCVKDMVNNANFIDVRNAFEKNKTDMQIYYKTDHHLTSKGSMLVYDEFCKVTGNKKQSFSLLTVQTAFTEQPIQKADFGLQKAILLKFTGAIQKMNIK